MNETNQKGRKCHSGSELRRKVVTARLVGAAAAGMLVATPMVRAAIYDFDPQENNSPSDGSNVWDTGAGNAASDWFMPGSLFDTTWSDSTADTAVFGAGGMAGTVTVAAGVNVGVIQFNAVSSGSYLLTGGSLNLGSTSPVVSGMITTAAGVTPTIATPITGTNAVFNAPGTLTLTGANTFNNATGSNIAASLATGTVVMGGAVTDNFNGELAVGSGSSPAGSTATPNIATLTIASGTAVSVNNNVGLGNGDNGGSTTAAQVLTLNINGSLTTNSQFFTAYQTAANTTATINVNSGGALKVNYYNFGITSGSTTNLNIAGTMTMTGGKPSINASAGSTAFNLHIMSGGSLTESFSADLNSDNASSTGTSNITLDNNSTFYNPGYFSLTTTAGETTTVTQNGGLFTAGNGGGGNAMFYNTGTSTYYLNGGVLSAPAVSTLGSATTSLGTFIFNGGTLQAQATGGGGNGINAGFFSPPAAEVGKGGGTFDTATNNYGILAVNTGITTDTALDNNGMDGGITKTGTTTLSMNGLSTYNGGTTVLAGTLIDGNATEGVGTGNVKVTPSSAAGATFQMNAATDLTATQSLILTDFTGTPDSALVNLSYTGADTIMSLVDDGSTLAGGLYGAPGSAAVFDGQAVIPEAFISGGGYLNVVGVPEPASFGLIGLVAPVLFGRRRRDRLMVVSE